MEEFTVVTHRECKVMLLRLIQSKRNTMRRIKTLNSRISVNILRIRRMSFKLTDLIKKSNQLKDPKRRQMDEPKKFQSNHLLKEEIPIPKIAKMTLQLALREISPVKIR
jgi:hypothetical protein